MKETLNSQRENTGETKRGEPRRLAAESERDREGGFGQVGTLNSVTVWGRHQALNKRVFI